MRTLATFVIVLALLYGMVVAIGEATARWPIRVPFVIFLAFALIVTGLAANAARAKS